MPYFPLDPLVPSANIDDLRNAVARWDDEGGADVTGPQEGYRSDGHCASNVLESMALAPSALGTGGDLR